MAIVLPCGLVSVGACVSVACDCGLHVQVWPFLRAPTTPPLSAGPPDSFWDLPPVPVPLATTVGFILHPVPPDQNPLGLPWNFRIKTLSWPPCLTRGPPPICAPVAPWPPPFLQPSGLFLLQSLCTHTMQCALFLEGCSFINHSPSCRSKRRDHFL